MRLLLIRHAVAAGTGTVLTGRLPGVELDEKGRAMAQALAIRLRRADVKALYSSPILRCRQTASALASTWGLPTLIDSGFVEVDYGAWSGRKLAALRKLKAWDRLMAVPSSFRFPEGETIREAQHRVVGAIERLAVKHPRSRVAVVSHNDVIRAALVHYLGMPLDLIHRIDVWPASVSVLDVGAHSPRVLVVNSIDEVRRWR